MYSEPTIYNYARQNKLDTFIQQEVLIGPVTREEAEAGVAVRGLRNHYERLLEAIPRMRRAEAALVHTVVSTISPYSTEVGATTLFEAYNARIARYQGVPRFDTSPPEE